MISMDNKMRDSNLDDQDEKDKLLRQADQVDRGAPLRADVMGSIAGSDPASPGYLGKINSLITAHGAVDKMVPPDSIFKPSEPGTRDYALRTESLSQPKIPSSRMTTATPPEIGSNAPATPPPVGFDPVNASRMVGPEKPQRGWLGRIGEVASKMGNIAGTALAPGVMAITPGTDLNKKFEAARQERTAERQRQLATEETRAGAEKLRAETEAKKIPETGKTPEEQFMHDALQGGPGGGPRLDPQGNPWNHLSAHKAWVESGQEAKPDKPETQEQNKLAFQVVIGKLDAAGLPTDPKSIDKSLDTARQRGIITPQEHSTARAYEAANPTPGTNLSVHVAGTQATENIKKANQHYLYSDDHGTTHLVTGDKVPPGADAVPVKDPQTFMSEAENANIVQKSFTKLAKDDLSIFDNPAARAVLATATSEEGARSMGLLVAGTGGSITLPAGMGKIIDQFLENKAPGMDDKTRRALKDYIADYWAIKDKMLMVQMQMQNGKMGRGNKAYFDAMVAQIPGAGTADSQMARRQLTDFNETLTELKKRYPDKFGGYRKDPDLKPDEFGADSGAGAPPPGAKVRDYTQLNK